MGASTFTFVPDSPACGKALCGYVQDVIQNKLNSRKAAEAQRNSVRCELILLPKHLRFIGIAFAPVMFRM